MAEVRPQTGKVHFHVALACVFAVGFGTLLTVVLAILNRRSAGPWARRTCW